MPFDFEKTFYAKCILSGEHAVLRKSPALVFPLKSYYLNLTYKNTDEAFEAKTSGPHGEPLKYLFWVLIDLALEKLERTKEDLKGWVNLESHLPLGGGLGASAALSMAVGELLAYKGLLKKDQLFDFCRGLEDHFHGESSGADIAIAFHKKPIRYLRKQKVQDLNVNWRPHLYLYYTGESGVTAECVSKVKDLEKKQPELFKSLDEQMLRSVKLCQEALEQKDSAKGFELLSQGLNLGQNCFEKWDLINPEVQKSIDYIQSQGVSAFKLTGSGRGGFLLGLWKEKPNKEALKKLVPLEF